MVSRIIFLFILGGDSVSRFANVDIALNNVIQPNNRDCGVMYNTYLTTTKMNAEHPLEEGSKEDKVYSEVKQLWSVMIKYC